MLRKDLVTNWHKNTSKTLPNGKIEVTTSHGKYVLHATPKPVSFCPVCHTPPTLSPTPTSGGNFSYVSETTTCISCGVVYKPIARNASDIRIVEKMNDKILEDFLNEEAPVT